MARARNIKPGFFTNDVLAEIDPLGRLLFIALWTMADRAGRLEDRPKRIKAEALPYDECDADALLTDLQEHGFIARYEASGQRFIQVLAFAKHQNPHIKEPASTIPAPDEHGVSTVQEPEEHGSGPADSGFLIPDSINHLAPDKPGAMAGFDAFWAAYPKKRSKGDAEKAWKSLKPDEALQAILLQAVEVAKARDDWRKDGGKFVPHPASWLRAKGWEDDSAPLRSGGGEPDPESWRKNPMFAGVL